ncbi:MAG: NUDIX domain-containing protein [Planctomycetes bacterium]|nr:NUDIX domain-containing protein [Planctomycetota bacterium]MBI3832940.1 NUDIX domain-containing protein [Planctomycetota bacterium]
MKPKTKIPRYVAGIIEDAQDQYLIALPCTESFERLWQFPRDLAKAEESSEAAMRRVAAELLGLTVEVIVGQPPIQGSIDGQLYEFRYFFCGVLSGEARSSSLAELRWISIAHLREYDFDAISKPVVEWILA